MDDAARHLIADAMAFAATCHRAQRRKDPLGSPYILHPTQVMLLLWDAGVTDPVVLAAALLHDTVEDTQARHEDLLERFGAEVAGVVAETSDDKRLPKSERKRLQIEQAATKSERARLVMLADKIANVRDMLDTPPPRWSDLRRRQYFGWARLVVAQMRGTHAALEAQFDSVYARTDAAPWPLDGSEATE